MDNPLEEVTSTAADVASMDLDEKEKGEESKPEAPTSVATNNEAVSEDPQDEEMKDYSSDNDTSSTDSKADVLTTEQCEIKLVRATQLKEEGNAHFKDGDLDKAMRAYRRGCSALKPVRNNSAMTDDAQVKSLLVALQTNLSMVCFKQKKWTQSIAVATQALSIDPTNVKVLYRRATASRQSGGYAAAKSDLRTALQQDPTNTACKKELATIKRLEEKTKAEQKKALSKAFSSKGGSFLYDDKEAAEKKRQERMEAEKKAQEELLKKRKLEWEDECVHRMAKNEPAISFEDWEKEQKEKEAEKQKEEEKKRKEEEQRRKAERQAQKKAFKAKQADQDDDDDDDDELTAEELRMMRGYKKTADGRTTSYFTRELSDAEKNRIGDIAPKRIESTPQPISVQAAAASASTAGPKGSVWNKAGTWEEKDTTTWCRAQLEKRLLDTSTSGKDLDADIVSVKETTGDASFAIAGGKKRYIFDFHARLNYELKDLSQDKVIAKGEVSLPDICSTSHEELEVAFGSWSQKPTTEWDTKAMEAREQLSNQLRASVQLWVEEFNRQY